MESGLRGLNTIEVCCKFLDIGVLQLLETRFLQQLDCNVRQQRPNHAELFVREESRLPLR